VKKMRTIMVDDEAWVLKQQQTETANLPDVEIVGVFRNAREALDFVALNPIDLRCWISRCAEWTASSWASKSKRFARTP
jgi:hypothetical protein